MKICVVGSGYVGLSLAVLISQKYNVTLLDIDENKIALLNKNISPILDSEIQNFLKSKKLNLTPTTDPIKAYEGADFVVIATPTDYEPKKGTFDTSSVELVISQAREYAPRSYIIIKSTIPLGFTARMRSLFKNDNIAFSPEFLREGTALKDNLYPSRIIVGDTNENAKKFAEILFNCSNVDRIENIVKCIDSSEAEAVKLFSNTYLAMRVAFFNELDTFAQTYNLSTMNIIEGVCSDPRIGNYYNNPSFGYGGYCLPKDTKQLLSNFDKIPNNLIKAIIDSNETRKDFIASSILNKLPKSVGIYRLSMKANSDNFRESAIFDIMNNLKKNNIKVYVYEPSLKLDLDGTTLLNDLQEFIAKSDIIVANRISHELSPVKNKVYTRDLFGEN